MGNRLTARAPATFCANYNQDHCRSCDGLEIPYADQLTGKERLLGEGLAGLGFRAPGFVLEPSALSPQTGFRDRAKLSVTGREDAPVIGLLGRPERGEDLDQGRELLDCPIHHPELNRLCAALPDFIRRFHLTPYRIAERKGELKGLIAFRSPVTGEMYLRFVLRSRECISRLVKLLPELQAAFPRLVCVSANLQPVPHALLEGPDEVFLTERKSIRHELGGLVLDLSPRAFVQTNAQVATELYRTAAAWVGEAAEGRGGGGGSGSNGTGGLKLLELFSGQGAFSFFAAPHASAALGIEINAEAVAMANETARRLGFAQLEFRASDAHCLGTEVEAFRPDLILANPPRRGLGESLDLILRASPRHLIYSSCASDTLIEDLRRLGSAYRPRRARIFDLFPHTAHFETLLWLERDQSR